MLVVCVNLYRNADGTCRVEVTKEQRKKRAGEPVAVGKPITEVEVHKLVRSVAKDADSNKAAQQRSDSQQEMPLCWCPAGEFPMGRTQLPVTLTRGFWMGKYEVTQAQCKALMGDNPSEFKGESLPAEAVKWNEAKKFCQKFTELERKAGRLPKGWEYRLPTEAQWEYACRADTTLVWDDEKDLVYPTAFGNDLSELRDYAWYIENSDDKTHAVGQKKPNAWGLCDMHGNVFEWVRDAWQSELSGGKDPEISVWSPVQTLRGSDFFLPAEACGSPFNRAIGLASHQGMFKGFRVALVSVDESGDGVAADLKILQGEYQPKPPNANDQRSSTDDQSQAPSSSQLVEGGRLATNASMGERFSQLMRQADQPGRVSQVAINELLRREKEGLLDSDQLNDLIDLILKHQVNRERPWRTEMGDLIEKRWIDGELDRDIWEKYTAQLLVDICELKVRPRIVIGSPSGVPVRRNFRDLRCGADRIREAVAQVHQETDAIYGAAKIAEELKERDDHEAACRNTVAKAMKQLGIASKVHRRGYRPTTTKADPSKRPAANVLNREFAATAPNQKWVTDITYVGTATGWVYVAAVVDLFSRSANRR